MPDPKQLKVGDRVRFVSLPEEWNQVGFCLHGVSLAFMKRMIQRRFPSRVVEIDEMGYPWIRAQIVVRGKTHYHKWLIMEATGWRQVQSKPSE